MKRVLIAYVPVLHTGYLTLFREHGGTLYLVGPDFVSAEYPRLIRDLRQVPVHDMVRAIDGLGFLDQVQVLNHALLSSLRAERAEVTLPDEDISHTLAEEYLAGCTVWFRSVFLRWDKPITLTELEVRPDEEVTLAECDRLFMQVADGERRKSADWWRQIGAVAVREGNELARGHNAYLPSNYNLFAAGNPRDNFDAGEHPDIYTALHAEAGLVARAANEGWSLAGASVYVTTFPCANCARLLAEAGAKKIYYRDGYSRLDAYDVLKAYNVTLVRVVDVPIDPPHSVE